jgi:hypothetical protein
MEIFRLGWAGGWRVARGAGLGILGMEYWGWNGLDNGNVMSCSPREGLGTCFRVKGVGTDRLRGPLSSPQKD